MHLHVNSFLQFTGEDLGNPNKFSELLETPEPERTFKKKVADDYEKKNFAKALLMQLLKIICERWRP